MRHERSLDALNFFLADVRHGLGPYIAIYLLTDRHWAEDRIGSVMTIATVCGLIVQTPAGALTDASHAKRAIVVAAALVVTGASILLPFLSSLSLSLDRKRRPTRRQPFSGRRSPRSHGGSHDGKSLRNGAVTDFISLRQLRRTHAGVEQSQGARFPLGPGLF
jgi:MFS family permease